MLDIEGFAAIQTQSAMRDSSWILQGNSCRLVHVCLAKPLAVPEKICATLPRLCLIFIDRCAFLALLHPPPAAQGSSTPNPTTPRIIGAFETRRSS